MPATTAADRRVLVTGAASGIGRAVAARFHAAGDRVAGLDLDAAGLGDAALAARVACDLRDPGATADAVEAAAAELGGLDAVVCCAGVIRHATVEDCPLDDWDEMMHVNARGPFLVAKHAIPHLRAAGGGAIVVVASQLGLVGVRASAAYCASKGAAIQLARAMAIDHAAERIAVNALCPGPTATPLLERDLATIGDAGVLSAAIGGSLPLGRLVEPEEIAAMAFYLCQPDARATNGASIVVDGGDTAR